MAPRPTGSIESARSWNGPAGGPELGPAEDVDARAVRDVEAERVERRRVAS